MKIPSWICHGIPERCLSIAGRKLPLCSRCTGFYSGLILGFGLELILGLNLGFPAILLIYTLSLIALGLDGITQALGYRSSNNRIRFSTGMLTGFWGGAILGWMLSHS